MGYYAAPVVNPINIVDARGGGVGYDILVPPTDQSLYGATLVKSLTLPGNNPASTSGGILLPLSNGYMAKVQGVSAAAYRLDSNFNIVNSWTNINNYYMNSAYYTKQGIVCTSFGGGVFNASMIWLYNPITDDFEQNNLNDLPSGVNDTNAAYVTVGTDLYVIHANGVYKLTGTLQTGNNQAPNPTGWVSPFTLVGPVNPGTAPASNYVAAASWDGSTIHLMYYLDSASAGYFVWYEYDIASNTWSDNTANRPDVTNSYGGLYFMPDDKFAYFGGNYGMTFYDYKNKVSYSEIFNPGGTFPHLQVSYCNNQSLMFSTPSNAASIYQVNMYARYGIKYAA